MRNCLLLIALWLSFPAYAQTPPATVAAPAPAATKSDPNTQETITLGNNRFLIFSGTASDIPSHGYGYTIDLVKIDNGIPHFDPLFIEDFDLETKAPRLQYGVAFMATQYTFNKADNSMTYVTFDPETNAHLKLTYKLDVDIFKLQEAVGELPQPCAKDPCPPSAPQTLFKVSANAQAH